MNPQSPALRRARRTLRAPGTDRSGALAIEFALIAPALLLTIFGGMEFGRMIWTQSALHLSVEAAARCGAVGLCTTSSAPAYAAAVTPQLQFASSVFSASSATCGFKVSASYAFTFIASGLFPYTPTLTALACVP
jgi:Flp pilus assembly protein TadG